MASLQQPSSKADTCWAWSQWKFKRRAAEMGADPETKEAVFPNGRACIRRLFRGETGWLEMVVYSL